MKRKRLLTFFNRLTALSEKLPKRLSHPILNELIPIREIFLEQRPARLMLLGESSLPIPEVLNTLCAGNWLRQISLEEARKQPAACDLQASGILDPGWQMYSVPNRGTLQILDARRAPDAPYSNFSEDLFQAHITRQPPDVAILLSPVTEREHVLLSRCGGDPQCPVLYLQTQKPSDSPSDWPPALSKLRKMRVIPFGSETATTELCELLPNPAKLETARLFQVRDSQRKVANALLHSFAAVCGLIGTQPIPLADLPILTSLQSIMIGTIAYCSGRRLSVKTVGEFLGAMGLNIGAGMLFREGARTAIRFVPFWGNAVAGFVAGTGTYAIGKAAIAYFVDEIPITSVRKILRTSKRAGRM